MDTLVLLLRVALSLAAVLGLLWFLQKKIAKGGKVRRAAGRMSVVGRQGLGRRASVVMLEADGQRMLLGVTEHAVTVLQSFEPEPATSTEPSGQRLAPVPAAGVPGEGARAFAQAMDAATSAPAPASAPAPIQFRSRRERAQAQGALAGSILSPATWRQTVGALKQGH